MARRTLLLVALSLFLAMAGFGIIIPSLPFYTARLQGEGPSVGFTVGMLMASYSLVQFVFAPIWGHMADRHGRKPIFMAGLAGFALSFALMGMARDLTWLFCARLLGGMLSAALLPSALSMVADATSEEDRGKGMGVAGAAMGMGFVFGPALGGLLAHGDDLQMPFFIASVVTGLTFLFATLVLDETRPEAESARHTHLAFFAGLRQHGAALWPWLVLTFLQTAIFALMEATLALYARDSFGLGARDVGYLLAVMGLVSALASGMAVGRLIRAFGEIATIKLGFALFAVGFATAPLAHSPPLLTLALIAIGVGMACMRPSLNSGVSKGAGEHTGSALGLMQSCDSLARVAGPAAGGALYVAGHALPFITGAAVSVGALAFTFLALVHVRRLESPDTSSSHPQSA